MTFLVIPNILTFAGFRRAALWNAEDKEGCAEDGIEGGGDGVDTMMEAVAIDSLDRTRSRGYVVQTLVTPAKAPAANRVSVSSSRAPYWVKNFFNCSYEVN